MNRCINSTYLLLFFVLILFFSCDSIDKKTLLYEEVYVDDIIESAEFIRFVSAFIDYSDPYIKQISNLEYDEVVQLQSELKEVVLSKEKNSRDLRDIVVRMGYDNQKHFDILYSNMVLQKSGLFQTFPMLKDASTDSEGLLFNALELYFENNYFYPKKDKLVYSGLESCLSIAYANYMLRTLGCVAMTTVHPLVALGCQIANSSIYSAEQVACYEQHMK